MYLCRFSGLAGMTKIAIFDRPGYFPVMAGAAVFTVDYLEHIDFVSARFKLEPEIRVTDFAPEADTMKPVWKNYRAHSRGFRKIIDQYIAVLRIRHKRRYPQGYDKKY
jgi:hypothetical protein